MTLDYTPSNIELCAITCKLELHMLIFFKLFSFKNKKCNIIMKKMYKPMISFWGAHTSNVSFWYPLITQWYKNFLGSVPVCWAAFLLQFFSLAALSHSCVDVGQYVTTLTLSTASVQYLLSHLKVYYV